MENTVNPLNLLNSSAEYKRKFSFFELYRALVYAPRAMRKLVKNKKSKLLSDEFVERLQLAITEVNGCPACSYQHTKMALQMGMSNEEISSFLSGAEDFIRPEEAKAIMFAQHFADSRGYPKKYAYEALIKEYGEEKAVVILSASQVMITGNIYGIPFSAFQSRLKGKTYKDSSLFFELGMLIGGILIMPIAILHGVLRGVIRLPNRRLDSSPDEIAE